MDQERQTEKGGQGAHQTGLGDTPCPRDVLESAVAGSCPDEPHLEAVLDRVSQPGSTAVARR